MSTIDRNLESLQAYRDQMDPAMETLAVVLRYTDDGQDDHEIAQTAARQLDKLYRLLELTGKYSPEELKIILQS